MAHEVNQPISGIIMNAGTALRFTAARGPVATAFLFKRARRSWKFAQRQPTFGAINLALLFAKLRKFRRARAGSMGSRLGRISLPADLMRA
jgi:hypothetical protein